MIVELHPAEHVQAEEAPVFWTEMRQGLVAGFIVGLAIGIGSILSAFI